MSEATPRRRSFTERLGGRTSRRGFDDDRSVGDRSGRSAGGTSAASSRRRRSRSPLRAASKTSKSIVGKLSKIAGKKSKKQAQVFEQAAAHLGYDDEFAAAPSSAGQTAGAPTAPEQAVQAAAQTEAGAKTGESPAPVPVLDDEEETVYGVVLDKDQPSASFDKAVVAAKKSVAEEAAEATTTAKLTIEKVKDEATTAATTAATTSAASVQAEKKSDTKAKETKKEAKKESSSKKADPQTKKTETKKEKKEKKKEEKKKKEAAKKAAKADPTPAPAVPVPPPAPVPAPVAEPAPAPVPIAPGAAIQIILLLMDPASRRFELLQLEFDSSRALVSDVLAQIPLSATVESMRTQKYSGVCDRKGVEMENTAKLVGFTEGRDGEVVLAIPLDMNARECAKLARPILGDPNVVAMLNPASAAALAKDDEKKKAAEKAEKEAEEAKSKSAPVIADKRKKSSGSFIGKLLKFTIFSVIIGFCLFKLQESITAPLGPGDRLKPGFWRSRCGLLTHVPPDVFAKINELAQEFVPDHAHLVPDACEPATIEMGKDGVLRQYGAEKEIIWEIAGSVCPEEDEECAPGLIVEEDGRLMIGGKPPKVGSAGKDMEPWPFTKDPSKVSSKWW